MSRRRHKGKQKPYAMKERNFLKKPYSGQETYGRNET
jgi:hypothetical protein